jgi:ornithine cyclodeaminase/alanine dehydrogenase-like protein (mu-crystallin family)
MVVFLSESDVQAAITMPEAQTIVEGAFRDYALGKATLLPRVSQTLPGTAGMFRILAATLPSMNMFGLKTLTGFPGRRLESEVYFAILLFEMGSGALRAVVSANYLTGLRTGAASGVAAKHLALDDASSLGIVGAGTQAWFQVEALCAVRPIQTVKIFSRDVAKAGQFAARVRQKFEVDAYVVGSAEEAVRGSALVVTATTASAPVVKGAWLADGTHVSGIGANTRTKRELDTECFTRARVFVDSREQVLEESGDLRDAVQSGDVTTDIVSAELGELAAGSKTGRSTLKEITIFKSVGVALQDIAVAASLFENAKRKGLGTEFDPYAASHNFVEAL